MHEGRGCCRPDAALPLRRRALTRRRAGAGRFTPQVPSLSPSTLGLSLRCCSASCLRHAIRHSPRKYDRASCPRAQNVTCLLRDLFSHALNFVRPSCLFDGCLPSEKCWLHCVFEAIIDRAPHNATVAVLERARSDASCSVREPDFVPFLDGPVDFVMGGDGIWNFGRWGSRRTLSNLKAWLTQLSNLSVYQGYHDWHTDGPSRSGRFHKVFLMVEKRVQEPGDLESTNVMLVPNDVLRASDCSSRHGSPFDAETVSNSIFAVRARTHARYVPHRRSVDGLGQAAACV